MMMEQGIRFLYLKMKSDNKGMFLFSKIRDNLLNHFLDK